MDLGRDMIQYFVPVLCRHWTAKRCKRQIQVAKIQDGVADKGAGLIANNDLMHVLTKGQIKQKLRNGNIKWTYAVQNLFIYASLA